MILLRGNVAWANRNSPERVAEWIKSQIPCTENGYEDIPFQTRNRIHYHLVYDSQVPNRIATDAMEIVFGGPLKLRLSERRGPAFGNPSPSATSDTVQISWYENRYKAAQIANNADEMEAILRAVLRILIRNAGGRDEKFEEANRAMRNLAPNVFAEVRHLTREELRRLRTAPVPDLVRLDIRPGRNVRRAPRRGK